MPAGERRAAILDAAMAVFAERGYHAASIDEIAREAEVSKALIYEHFASKQALWASLLDTQVAEIFRRLAAGAATSEPGEVRLRSGVDAFLTFVEERRGAWRMLFREAADPEVAAFLDRVYTGRFAQLPVGRLSYALACDESGVVIEDGLVARLAEDRFYVTATTTGAACRKPVRT